MRSLEAQKKIDWNRGFTTFSPIKSSIDICPTCLKKYVKTQKSPNQCLPCFYTTQPKQQFEYEYRIYKPHVTFTELTDKYNAAIRRWRSKNKDKVNKWKREHKKRHPESVKSWNERYRNKNRDRLKFQFRVRYKIIKQMKTVNDNILVKPFKEEDKEIVTNSGIILTAPIELKQLKRGIIKYVPLKPSIAVKKGDTIAYSYGIQIEDKNEVFEIVSLKEVLAIL